MKKLGIILVRLAARPSLTGCNSARGMGRDVQSVRAAVKDAAP